MRLLAFAIGAAFAAPPASAPVDSSLKSELQPTESAATPATPVDAPAAPGLDVMKPLPAPQDRCLSARCATV